MENDPVTTNPGLYTVVFENERVRVLEYTDTAGTASMPHAHPDSVMVTLSSFARRLHAGDGRTFDTQLPFGAAMWLPAQSHSGENTGSTPTHAIFVELKESSPLPAPAREPLGPGTS